MQATSGAYQNEMNKLWRGQSFMRITFGLIDLDAAETSNFIDSGHMYFSSTDELVRNDKIPRATYATFEKGRMKLDGSAELLIASGEYPIKQGYVSDVLSDENCIFTQKPYIDVTFTKKHSTEALSFVFDKTTGDYPAEFEVQMYRGDSLVKTVVSNPNNAIWVVRSEFHEFDRLLLVFNKTVRPYNRVRLQNIVFGIGIMFENLDISDATQTMDIDPVMRRLPTNTFDFSIINKDWAYNPDNPSGVWEDIEDESPIKVEYGREITSGATWADAFTQTWADAELLDWKKSYEGGYNYWLNGGSFILSAQPSTKDLLASFKCYDRLSTLTDTYYKGMYRRDNLYNLALQVLKDANIPNINNNVGYKLSDSLKNIYTNAPMPKRTHKECLQIIAHAARMILYVDRDGYIQIQPISNIQNDLKLDFSNLVVRPTVTKVPTLRSVSANIYSFLPVADVSEIHKDTYAVGTYMVSFDFATNITVVGATIVNLWSGAANIRVDVAGEVVISGKRLNMTQTVETIQVNAKGEPEKLDNALVTDVQLARDICEYVRDYLVLRNTYEFEYRGSPEIDSTDKVWLQSQFDSNFAAMMLKNTIKFNGAIHGQAVMKRMDVV
ncbi:MAG: hypothetical protein RR588_12550 [Solibacillus sp.]